MTDEETLTVSCKLKNEGAVAGKEIAQLYVGEKKSTVGRPVRELKGFTKVELQPGEERTVTFVLDSRAFAYYEPKIHDWFVESGTYVIEVAASSRDIRLQKEVQVNGTRELPYHYTAISTIGSLHKTARGREVLDNMMKQLASSVQDNSVMTMDADALGEGSEQMMQNSRIFCWMAVERHVVPAELWLMSSINVLDQNMKMLYEGIFKELFERIGLTERQGMFYFTYFKEGFLAILWQWLKDDCLESSEELAKILTNSTPESPVRLLSFD